EAWDTLEAHYDKKKYTVFALVREFIDQPSTSTVSGLKKLVTTSDDVIRQLKALGNEFESRDPWLIHLLLEKVDKETRSLWAQKIIDVDNPMFADFLEFLQKRCDALETCTAFTKRPNQADNTKRDCAKAHISEKVQSFHANTSSSGCVKCLKDHPIYHCDRFKEMEVAERRELAQTAKLCFNCLRSSHTARKFPSKSVCRFADCKQCHHTLLCTREARQKERKSEQDQSKREIGEELATASVNVNSTQTHEDGREITLLPTVVTQVAGSDGKLYDVRALVDSGSQVSLITEACVKRLGLRRSNATLEVTGVNAEVVGKTAGKVTLVITPRFEKARKLVTQAYVLGKLTATLPCQRFNVSNMSYLEGLQLADPQFNKPGSMDIILGADVFLSILQSGQVKDHYGNPVAQRSVFGWMVAGKVSTDECAHSYHSVINLHQEEGRFIVRLPMDDSKLKLGDSLVAATRRLRFMERRFDNDSGFKQRYVSFMQEYQELGHMKIVPQEEIDVDCSQSYYLPHHGVIKEESATTKLRVVFDGSAVTTSGTSLNDVLLDAPNINADLFEVLLRFRSYQVAFIADIEKMYRQVLVHPSGTDYTRIV
ncbi:uncharacterized protein LOC134202935, partial [Armigeres subalbatus]|uniref:uncharacterized protein LOC134202935 n=1 Tax=Armigeres subalbatus TaxID=124917 RepID=UPI002ED02CD4